MFLLARTSLAVPMNILLNYATVEMTTCDLFIGTCGYGDGIDLPLFGISKLLSKNNNRRFALIRSIGHLVLLVYACFTNFSANWM